MPQFNKDEYEERGPMQVPAGQYPFAVVEAKEAMSKAGNEMINLELQFDVGAEKPMTIYDRLVFTKKALFRIKQFTDMGENSVVAIKFNSGQTKSLMVKYANLSEVDI